VVLVDEARRAGDTVLLAEHRHESRAPRLSTFHALEIVFGPHSLAEAAHAAVRLGARRPFVVTDPGLMSAGWPSELLDELRGAGLAPVVWRDLPPNPSAFDARSASAMVRSLAGGGPPERERLADRELDVLRLLARGLSNRAIGAELFISETTVKFHVGNLMRKLMVSRRAEAVYAASKLGLL
jgi:DNA-binding NarL/FixJ family response regulator